MPDTKIVIEPGTLVKTSLKEEAVSFFTTAFSNKENCWTVKPGRSELFQTKNDSIGLVIDYIHVRESYSIESAHRSVVLIDNTFVAVPNDCLVIVGPVL